MFARIAAANADDVGAARGQGRSTTRLVLSDRMRADMVAGLRTWRDMPSERDQLLDGVEHEGWRVERRRAPLGVIGFVFEGRPNVFADATGVLRGGNTVVFRIGRDALGTALAIHEHALVPALGGGRAAARCGRAPRLPVAGDRLRAVLPPAPGARGGTRLGAGGGRARRRRPPGRRAGEPPRHRRRVARRRAGRRRRPLRRRGHALARPQGLQHAQRLLHRQGSRRGARAALRRRRRRWPASGGRRRPSCGWLWAARATWIRAGSPAPSACSARPVRCASSRPSRCPSACSASSGSGRTARRSAWSSWRTSTPPSPSSTSTAPASWPACSRTTSDEQERFWAAIDAPFVGDGFTRWVDGQFAFDRPELGLSNWQHGRLFARGGVLSGDSVYTVRTRAFQTDPDLHR